MAAMDAWNHSDFVCKNYILIGIDNTLYDVCSSIKAEDARMKKIHSQ